MFDTNVYILNYSLLCRGKFLSPLGNTQSTSIKSRDSILESHEAWVLCSSVRPLWRKDSLYVGVAVLIRNILQFGRQFCRVGLFPVECNVARSRIALGIELDVMRGKLLLLRLEIEGSLIAIDRCTLRPAPTATCPTEMPERWAYAVTTVSNQPLVSASDVWKALSSY
jgi:hypothetical protein